MAVKLTLAQVGAWLFVGGVLTASLVSCGAMGDDASYEDGNMPGAGGTDGIAGNGGSGGSGGSGGDPPEEEREGSFRAPVATTRYVWSANTESGRVALIDAARLEVRVVEAGFQPTLIAAVSRPGEDRDVALVLNSGSWDATVLTATEDGVAAKTAKLHPGANAWAVSPSGRWAVAWSDFREVTSPDPVEGYQDLTLMDLDSSPPEVTRVSVGFRPTRLSFAEDESELYVVTEPGISIVELGDAPGVAALLALPTGAVGPLGRDVTVTPSGEYALVRQEGEETIDILPLSGAPGVTLELGAPVTDLDMTEDGARGIAALRATSEVVVFDVSRVLANPEDFNRITLEGAAVGSVSLPATPRRAMVYSTALQSDKLTILDLTLSLTYLSHRTVELKAPIFAALGTDNAEYGIALMSPPQGSQKAGAFAVVPLGATTAPRIVATDAPVHQVALAPDGTRAVVTTRDDAFKRYGVHLARMPSLQVDHLTLASAPLSVGVVPSAGRAFVSQQHPEGRITFIDLDTGSARTLTGFELGSRVVQ